MLNIRPKAYIDQQEMDTCHLVLSSRMFSIPSVAFIILYTILYGELMSL
jgi:hypothetical protein